MIIVCIRDTVFQVSSTPLAARPGSCLSKIQPLPSLHQCLAFLLRSLYLNVIVWLVAAKVDPISPVLIFENVTTASEYLALRSTGLPDIVEQGPRMTPGAEALNVVGYVLLSHSMPLPESSQMLNTSTMPRLSALLIPAMPPYYTKVLVLLETPFCELQKPSEGRWWA